MPWLQIQSAFGIAVLVLLSWAISENRRAFSWRLVLVGVGLQIALALLFLGLPFARDALFSLNAVVDALASATRAGTAFVFGYVGGGDIPFDVTQPNNTMSLAFQALPLVIVMSALAALLWYWRILPVIVRGIAFLLQRSMGLGGAVGLSAAANIFLGMVEAPLLIRPYLARLTRSELFMVCTTGLASVAGTVMVLYATILGNAVPGALGHILVASFISLPAAILISKVMVPGEGATPADAHMEVEYRSSMDAITRGTEDGLRLYLGILAMLIVMVALVALANIIVGNLPPVGGAPLTVERMVGWLFAPVVWLYGIPTDEAAVAGSLLGTKTILNEFIAYLNLAGLPEGVLSPRSELIMLYAMCGFANFGSVGIMIAGLANMVPERRAEIVELSLKSLVSGTIATGMTGAVVGMLPFF
jgi:CNT family concentrative nucleoside transporter